MKCEAPTELTIEDIDKLMSSIMSEEIKLHDCFKCGEKFFPNYDIGKCDECFFKQFSRDSVKAFYKSFFE